MYIAATFHRRERREMGYMIYTFIFISSLDHGRVDDEVGRSVGVAYEGRAAIMWVFCKSRGGYTQSIPYRAHCPLYNWSPSAIAIILLDDSTLYIMCERS